MHTIVVSSPRRTTTALSWHIATSPPNRDRVPSKYCPQMFPIVNMTDATNKVHCLPNLLRTSLAHSRRNTNKIKNPRKIWRLKLLQWGRREIELAEFVGCHRCAHQEGLFHHGMPCFLASYAFLQPLYWMPSLHCRTTSRKIMPASSHCESDVKSHKRSNELLRCHGCAHQEGLPPSI